jgi:hypothetical protein
MPTTPPPDLSADDPQTPLEASADGLQTLDGMRLSTWIASAPISRATTYQLLQLLQITPGKARVPGSRAEVAMLSREQVAALDQAAARMDNGATLSQLATALAPVRAVEVSADDPQTDDPSVAEGLLQRLQAGELAMRTGLPLSSAEVRWLLGARPGGAEVRRGRVKATRHARGVWSLSADDPQT